MIGGLWKVGFFLNSSREGRGARVNLDWLRERVR